MAGFAPLVTDFFSGGSDRPKNEFLGNDQNLPRRKMYAASKFGIIDAKLLCGLSTRRRRCDARHERSWTGLPPVTDGMAGTGSDAGDTGRDGRPITHARTCRAATVMRAGRCWCGRSILDQRYAFSSVFVIAAGPFKTSVRGFEIFRGSPTRCWRNLAPGNRRWRTPPCDLVN